MKSRIPVVAIMLLCIGLGAMLLTTRERIDTAQGPGTPGSDAQPAVAIEDDANGRADEEFLSLRDPRTNAIPYDIRRREMVFAKELVQARSRSLRTAAFQPLVWTERGPNNVGGRTRVFAIDVSAPTTLIAGSVAGGIWRSTNDGVSWSLRTSPGHTHSTTCIAQDRRAGKTATWYLGTGEIRGSTTNDTRWGSLYRGDGIFKSTDGGLTWAPLPATVSGTPQSTDAFDFVINVATNPANAGQDELLAATHTGIRRSIDGGGSWTSVIASDSGFTDVAITPAGVMYAATRTSGALRVWRSTNGTTWTQIQPVGFPSAVNRVVIGLAPSNANAAYFFLQGGSTGPGGHGLWKYTYLSGNGSGTGGSWADRTANLPSDLNTQTGYDQVINVKPDDENFVIIGGTNLYRSTNGFASTAATTVIGGYPFYPGGNHHPDLHAGAYSPVDSKIYYSAGDGGVTKAADITLANMVWQSLNNGYNVTQFYSVAISPDAGSNIILAGAQDNGSQLGNAPGASNWIHAYGGDGTIVEVSTAADNRLYTQYQNGPAQRQNWDGSNVTTITPTGSFNQMFVNPILLDPNNSSLLYYAAGNSTSSSMIWRNDNGPTATPTVGWTALTATNVGAGTGYFRRISAIGLSTANNPNVMYYGTVDGMVMKAVNIHTGAPTVTNITPPGLFGGTASGGFVRCVAVDPANSNRALVAFGNYSWPSLWYTTDAGATWTNVEGNLAGATGPSIRFATMFTFDGQLHVFLATSIGVLSTTALAGGATVWSPEAVNEIGNVIVGWLDYRPSDNTLAIGTHARGVFTTQFLPIVTAADPPAHGVPTRMTSRVYPNPARERATVAFELPHPTNVSLRLYDVGGREVARLADGELPGGRHEVPFATDGLSAGAYYYELRAGGVTETRKLMVAR